MDLNNPKIQECWRRYHADGGGQALSSLIEAYYPLLERVANTVIAKRPSRRWDKGDLINQGVFSLIQLIKNFRADRGIAFESYAYGPLLARMAETMGGLRWESRHQHFLHQKTERLRALAVQKLHRPLLEDEFEAMIKVEGIVRTERIVAQIVEIDNDDDNLTPEQWMADPGKPPIDQIIANEAPSHKPEIPFRTWKAFFVWHAEMSMEQVAEKLGVSRSAVGFYYETAKRKILRFSRKDARFFLLRHIDSTGGLANKLAVRASGRRGLDYVSGFSVLAGRRMQSGRIALRFGMEREAA